MGTRRDFIKNTGKGAALSTLALSSSTAFASKFVGSLTNESKPLIIGIIGAENSHSTHFGRIFNIEKQFPGVELKYIWGETEEFAKKAMKNGQIPIMVKDPNEMLGKIDALIVDHRHPKYHLEPAIPFIKAGIPTFIDKPFSFSLAEGEEFLALARKYGTPVTSFSTIAQSENTFDIKKQVESMGEIKEVVRYGPVDLDSKYGGVFFYGVHIVQPLLFMFGEDVEKVKITRNGNKGSAAMVFKSGLFATLIFKSLSYGWSTYVDTKDGVIELNSNIEEPSPKKADADIIEMFRTGEEPRSHESILKCVAVLEALHKSAETEDWVTVESVTV